MLKFIFILLTVFSSYTVFSESNKCSNIFDLSILKESESSKMTELDPNQVIHDLISRLQIHSKIGIEISNKKLIDVIFDKAENRDDPLFVEAFQLLPYIKNGDLDYNTKIFNILKKIFHSSDSNTLFKVVSAISDNFYVWSGYFSFKSIKALVRDHQLMQKTFNPKDFDAFFNSMEIYEAAINDLDYNKSLIHDTSQFSHKENNILSEYKHLSKIKRTIIISLLQVFSYLSIDANKFGINKSKQMYDEIVSFVSDLNYLSEFSKKEDPIQVVENEFSKLDKAYGSFITNKETARHILDLAELRVKEGFFDRKVFYLLPFIHVKGLVDLHSFRIQQIVQSALSPSSKISQQVFEMMLFDLERWLPYLTTDHIKGFIDLPLLAHAKQESLQLMRLDLKELLKVMNIIDHVAERKFWHPIYLENLIFSMLNKIVAGGRKIYIKRMAIVASLSVHSNLFRSHPDLYDGYHPYFYDNLLGVLRDMQKVWNGSSYLCLRMLQIIRENDKLFGVYPSEPDMQKQQNARNIEKIVEKIRKNWIQSVKLSAL